MHRRPGFLIALWVAVLVLLGIFAFGANHGRWDWDDGPGYGWRGMGNWAGRSPEPGGWYGMDAGMMTGPGWAGAIPGLTADQQQKIAALQVEAESSYRALMQQRWELRARLDRQYAAEPRDWVAIRKAALALADSQRQQAEADVDLQQKMAALLTDDQRRELSRWQRGAGGWGAP